MIDVDGVLADFVTPTLDIVRRTAGIPMVLTDWHTWDLFDIVSRDHEDAIYQEWCQPGFCESLPRYQGAVEAVQAIREVADVYFVTSPMVGSRFWMPERETWLRNHFGANHREIVFCAAKQIIVGDILIDDRPQNVGDWKKAHNNGRAILWAQAFNRSDPVPDGVVKTNSWEVVRDFLTC